MECLRNSDCERIPFKFHVGVSFKVIATSTEETVTVFVRGVDSSSQSNTLSLHKPSFEWPDITEIYPRNWIGPQSLELSARHLQHFVLKTFLRGAPDVDVLAVTAGIVAGNSLQRNIIICSLI